MTPLGVEIMLHYYYSPVDYREGDITAPAVNSMLYDLCAEGMLMGNGTGPLRITDRGKVWVEAICSVPFPVLSYRVQRPE